MEQNSSLSLSKKYNEKSMRVFLIVLCSVGFLGLLSVIFYEMIIFISGDTTFMNSYVYEMFRQHRLIPADWNYATTTYWFGRPLVMAALSLFVKNQILLNSFGLLFSFFLLLGALFFLCRALLLSNKINLFLLFAFCSIVIVSFGSQNHGGITDSMSYKDVLYNQAGYLYQLIYTIFFIALFLLMAGESLEIFRPQNRFLLIVFSFSLVIVISSSAILILENFVIPLMITTIVLFFIKKGKSTLKRFWSILRLDLFIGGLALIGLICNKIIFQYHSKQIERPMAFLSENGLANGFEQMASFIMTRLLGFAGAEDLFSLGGILSVLRFAAGFSFTFLFPILLLKKWSLIDEKVRFFLIFSISSFFCSFFLTFFTSLSLAPRYFLISHFLLFLLSGYYILLVSPTLRFPKKQGVFAVLCCLLIIFSVPRIQNVQNAPQKTQSNYALTNFLKDHDLRFGYGETYWFRPVSTLSNFQIELYDAHTLAPNDENAMKKDQITRRDSSPNYVYEPEYYNGRTFLIMKTEHTGTANKYNHFAPLGPPVETFEFEGNTIFVYDYNIGVNGFAGPDNPTWPADWNKPVEPTPEDPNAIEPTPEDPNAVEPTPEDPNAVEPTPEDPNAVEPTPEDPNAVEPTPEDPNAVEPTPEDPNAVEPTPEDPDAISTPNLEPMPEENI